MDHSSKAAIFSSVITTIVFIQTSFFRYVVKLDAVVGKVDTFGGICGSRSQNGHLKTSGTQNSARKQDINELLTVMSMLTGVNFPVGILLTLNDQTGRNRKWEKIQGSGSPQK